jgi:putative endonuclease
VDRAILGRSAEDIAADFLVAQGLTILVRNYRRRSGEIDLVAREEGDVLVIAEVRTRSTEEFGGAAASVDGWKQHKIIRAAMQLLQERKELARLRVRFDVLVVRGAGGSRPTVEWLKHAFEARE